MAKDKSEKKAKKVKDTDVSITMGAAEDVEMAVADESKASIRSFGLRAVFADCHLSISSRQRNRRRKEMK